MWIILLIILAIYSYRDIREKAIPVAWGAAGLILSYILGICRNMLKSDMVFGQCILFGLLGLLPGLLLGLLALILKGKIGSGDGMVLAVIGSLTGIEYGVMILVVALGLSFIYSCILLACCRKRKDYCFPFVPFYFLGAMIVYIVMVG